MWSPEILAAVIGTFVLAGTVKGVVGLGMPTVALALLTALVGFHEALVLMLAPAFVGNIWQSLSGPYFLVVVRRFWPMIAAGAVCIWITSVMLTLADPRLLSAALGVILCVYATILLFAPQPPVPGRHERWLTPLVGGASGAIAGLTGTFMVPSAIYFQALQLERDLLIQALGVWLISATVMLGWSLERHDLLPPSLALLSAVAVVPALAGMWFGQQIRSRLSESAFRKIFLYALLALGLYIVARSVL